MYKLTKKHFAADLCAFCINIFFLTTSFVYCKIKIQFTEENDYYLLDLLLSIGIYRADNVIEWPSEAGPSMDVTT